MLLISDGNPIYLVQQSGKRFQLTKDWRFKHPAFNGIVAVPAGYYSDLASVPSFLFWWQFGRWNIPAICHDFMYEHGFIYLDLEVDDSKTANGSSIVHSRPLRTARLEIQVSKAEADLFFYEVAIAVGVSPITAKLMYWACCLFGKGIWQKSLEN